MSLIIDATRAAQREKERRASGASAGRVPLLVSLKSKARSDFDWRRVVLFVGGGGALLAVGWIVLQQNRNAIPRALRTPGPTLVSIATPQVTATTARDSTRAKELTRGGDRTDSNAQRLAASAPRTRTKLPQRPQSQIVNRQPVGPARLAAEDAPAASRTTGQLLVFVDQPRDVEAARLFAAGVAAQRAGDLSGARSAYEQVLAIAPNDVDALNNLGVLLSAQRNFDRAETALRRAIALAPSNAGAWNNLGALLRQRGRSADAIAAFQYALSLEPRHAGARVGLAQQYLVIGALAQARHLLEDVLRDYPASPEASYALGQVLERQGDRPGAIRAYTTFMRVAPPALAAYVDAVRRRVETLSAATP